MSGNSGPVFLAFLKKIPETFFLPSPSAAQRNYLKKLHIRRQQIDLSWYPSGENLARNLAFIRLDFVFSLYFKEKQLVGVSLLALLGIREEKREWISQHYAAMAIAMLITLAAAIRFFWRKAVNKIEKE